MRRVPAPEGCVRGEECVGCRKGSCAASTRLPSYPSDARRARDGWHHEQPAAGVVAENLAVFQEGKGLRQ